MRSLSYLSLVVLAACVAHQDLGSKGSSAQRECPSAQCGPALGLPNYTCADGTTAGPTGRCLENQGGTCSWEVVSCSTVTCTAESCAGQPIPAIACANASTLTTCEPNAQGTCAWKISCGGSTDGGTGTADAGSCTCTDPRPLGPNEICWDGSIGGPVCGTGPDRACSWQFRACPSGGVGTSEGGVIACLPSECSDPSQCPVGQSCVEIVREGPCISKQCCPAFGCAPMCPNGVLKDSKGCDTCECAPSAPTCRVDADCPALELCVPCGDTCAARLCVGGTCQWVCPP